MLQVLRLFVGALISLSAATSATAQAERSSEIGKPIIRLELGAHSAEVFGLAVSRDGKRAATASYDQTVRLWSMPAVDLIRTIRIPVGPTPEGSVFAAAFAPNAKRLAVTGRTGAWEQGQAGPWCIYLVDPDVGDIADRICGLPGVANRLAYSPDGKYLAVAMKWGKGVRVYRTDNNSLFFEDDDYQDSSTWVDFDPVGRMATASLDGRVRLYENDFKLVSNALMEDGRKPLTVNFSPSGEELAVGFGEAEGNDPNWPARVEILSTFDLSLVFRPDVKDLQNGTLWRVAWASDGQSLYAGGTWQKNNRYPIRRWGNRGRGVPQDVSSAPQPITELRAVSTGGVAFVGGMLSLGLTGPGGVPRVLKTAPTPDFTNAEEFLRISEDGLTVHFAADVTGAKLGNFSFSRRLLEKGDPPINVKMLRAITESPGLDVRGWRTYNPSLNGKPLSLSPHDVSNSLAIAPSKQTFLLGSNWYVYRFDANGRVVWATPTLGSVQGLVVTADERLIVAALSDGTLRWYSMESGAELVTLFADIENRRWIAWTQSGYYMAAAGADGLVGWQVNRGKNRAGDFFMVSRFRHYYYRPDVVIQSIVAASESQAIESLLASGAMATTRDIALLLPPVVEDVRPVSPEFNSPGVVLKYKVRTPSGEPVTEIRVLCNGRHCGTFKPSKTSDLEGEAPIIAPQEDCEFQVFAANQFTTSEPTTIKLTWTGKVFDSVRSPSRAFVLAIGTSTYSDTRLKPLSFGAKDADDFASTISEQEGKVFKKVFTKVLKSEQDLEIKSIRAGLQWLRDSVEKTDLGILFLAGHGIDSRSAGFHYLSRFSDLDRLDSTAISNREILEVLRELPGVAVLFIDACHAGGVNVSQRIVVDIDRLASEMSQPENGVVVYASSTGSQTSLEFPPWQNGAFTKAVVEGIKGQATYGNKKHVTSTMLDLYVKERVKVLTAGAQTPVVNMPLAIAEFRIAAVQP